MENTTEFDKIPFNDSSYFAFSYPLAVSALSTVSQVKAANLHPALSAAGVVSQKKAGTMLRAVPAVVAVTQIKAVNLHPALTAPSAVTQKKAVTRRSSAIMAAVLTQLKAITLHTRSSPKMWTEFNDSAFNVFNYTPNASISSLSTVTQQKTIVLRPLAHAISSLAAKKMVALRPAVAAVTTVTQQKAVDLHPLVVAAAVLSQLKAVTLRTHDSLAYWYEFNSSAFNVWRSTSAPSSLSISSTVTQAKAVNLHPLRTAPSVVTVRKSSTLHPTVSGISTISQKKAINLHHPLSVATVASMLKAITLHTKDTLVYWFEFDYAPFNVWTGTSAPSSLSAASIVTQVKSINLHPTVSAISTISTIKAIVRKARIAIPMLIDHIWTIWPERALAILSTITLRKIVNLHLINSPHGWVEHNEDAFNVYNVSPGASLSALSTISQQKAVDLHMPIIPVVSTISSEKKVLRGFSLATSGIVSILKNIGAKRLIAAASTISQKKAVELQQEVAASVTVAQVKAVTLRQELAATSTPTVQKAISLRPLVLLVAVPWMVKHISWKTIRLTLVTLVQPLIRVHWLGFALKAKARIETLKGKVRK